MKNKTILITGCSSGFGKDSAVALNKRGHKVIATTRTEEDAVKINDLDIECFKLDVTKEEDRKKILDYDVDVLINNAGDGESGALAEIPVDKIRSNFEINVFGPMELAQLALKKMMKRDSGTVVFVSSLAGRTVMPFLAPYCMTKFALSGGIDAMRQEMKKVTKNVHVCLIEPGAYHTGFNQDNIAKKYKWMNEQSYFYNQIDDIKAREEKYFDRFEYKSTKTIVKKIVRAAEAEKPKLRYIAPWWQGVGVQLMRIFGK